ncbi:MAG: hypothetical protein V1723_05000 [Candidatus Uhrbacteria bacterium]
MKTIAHGYQPDRALFAHRLMGIFGCLLAILAIAITSETLAFSAVINQSAPELKIIEEPCEHVRSLPSSVIIIGWTTNIPTNRNEVRYTKNEVPQSSLLASADTNHQAALGNIAHGDALRFTAHSTDTKTGSSVHSALCSILVP